MEINTLHPGGEVWTPGQRVTVKNDVLDIDGVFFLTGRGLGDG